MPLCLQAPGHCFKLKTWHDAMLTRGLGGDPSLGLVTASYYAWFEWFPAHSYGLSGFSVAPGQGGPVTVGLYTISTIQPPQTVPAWWGW